MSAITPHSLALTTLLRPALLVKKLSPTQYRKVLLQEELAEALSEGPCPRRSQEGVMLPPQNLAWFNSLAP